MPSEHCGKRTEDETDDAALDCATDEENALDWTDDELADDALEHWHLEEQVMPALQVGWSDGA